MNHRYFVIANRFGQLKVAVNEDYQPRTGDVILYRAHTVDEAFDWKEEMQHRVDQLSHCATCG